MIIRARFVLFHANSYRSAVAEHFIIFCDESAERGTYYSHFYGGALVRASDREAIEKVIADKKAELNIKGEIKWTKITANYRDKYIELVDTFFDLIEAGLVKVRIMFTQNINVLPEMDEERVDNEYFMLYYQFVKHAFGLRYWNTGNPHGVANVSVYLDDPPQNPGKFRNFKTYMASLSDYPIFSSARVRIAHADITGVRSHDHGIMQCLDIVLGGVQSRLNEVHTKPAKGERRRGKRARAKADVYARIKDRIWKIYPRFNVGTSTGQDAPTDKWNHPYRHWCFVPRESTMDRSRGKKK